MRKIYFDCNATTPIHPEVAEFVQPFLGELFGNPSSLHWAGREVRAYFERAREQVSAIIGAEPEEVIFESSGTESDNHALKGIVSALRSKGNHIITTQVEHPAVLNTCKYLETKGYRVTYLPVDGTGLVDPSDVGRAITRETILVSVMYANNETGNVMPLREIGEITQSAAVLFHSDMVQALGKTDIDVRALMVDLASFSGHKVYAPKGVGALYVRNGVTIDSLVHGGHQEGGLRAGTENVIGIVAFGKACEVVKREMAEEMKRVEHLRNRLLEGIRSEIDDVRLNGHPGQRLPNTLNISFAYVESESLLLALDLEGIAVSSGSACSSGSGEPSHVLLAMGIPPWLCQSAVRFSLGRVNREEDIDYALSVIPRVVSRLREMSPFYKSKS
jgi:cysteine desulfurase